MPLSELLDIDLAVFLAGCCVEAYTQYKNGGDFRPPKAYHLVRSLYGTAANRSQLFGYIIESPEAIVIAFRGSQSDPDWAADLAVHQTRFLYFPQPLNTHAGFTAIYGSFRTQIIGALKKFSDTKPIFVTGHSLGGALAVLCALDLQTNTRFQPTMYNFGAPRVGDPHFAEVYDKTVHSSMRIVNIFDIVTELPPASFNSPFSKTIWYYGHTDKAYSLAVQTASISSNHNIKTYLRALFGIKKAKDAGSGPVPRIYV